MAVDGTKLDAVRRERGQGKNNFPFQLTMNRIANLTRLIPTLLNDFIFIFSERAAWGGGGGGRCQTFYLLKKNLNAPRPSPVWGKKCQNF